MPFPRTSSRRFLLLLWACLAIGSCKSKKHQQFPKQLDRTTGATAPAQGKPAPVPVGCDTSLWRHVYNPTRLTVLDYCKTVTGVIVESSADRDGDQHMLLKPDAGQEGVVNARNLQKKQGNLVLEAVCANNTTLGKVGHACDGYVNKVQLPPLGAHVKASGSYVIDTHNGWAELHPLTRIDILP